MVREFDWRYFFDQIEFDRDAIGGGIGLIGEIMFGENAGLSQQPATHLTVQVAKAQTSARGKNFTTWTRVHPRREPTLLLVRARVRLLPRRPHRIV